jgi:two-component system OmpR family sensor kinase
MAVSPSEGSRPSGQVDDQAPSVSEFVSMASHDLKAPLAAITGYAVTLERRGESLDSALRHEMLEHIGEAAARMQSAVSQLVDYARLELGVIEMTPAVLDLSEAARSCAYDYLAKCSDCEIEIEPSGPVKVVADPDRLGQTLTTVIENAVRHGRGKAKVSVGIAEGVGVVRVEDAGEGVPESLEAVIFSADLTLRPRMGQPRGLGIALHNARRMMRTQGGDLELVRPRSGGGYSGAAFEISVPLAESLEALPESTGG